MEFDLSTADVTKVPSSFRVKGSRSDSAIRFSELHPVWDSLYEKMDSDGYTFQSRLGEFGLGMLMTDDFKVVRREMKQAGSWAIVPLILGMGLFSSVLLAFAFLFLDLARFSHVQVIGGILNVLDATGWLVALIGGVLFTLVVAWILLQSGYNRTFASCRIDNGGKSHGIVELPVSALQGRYSRLSSGEYVMRVPPRCDCVDPPICPHPAGYVYERQVLVDYPSPVPESLHQWYDDFTTVESHNIIGSRKPLIRNPEVESGFSVARGYMVALVIGGAGLALLLFQ